MHVTPHSSPCFKFWGMIHEKGILWSRKFEKYPTSLRWIFSGHINIIKALRGLLRAKKLLWNLWNPRFTITYLVKEPFWEVGVGAVSVAVFWTLFHRWVFIERWYRLVIRLWEEVLVDLPATHRLALGQISAGTWWYPWGNIHSPNIHGWVCIGGMLLWPVSQCVCCLLCPSHFYPRCNAASWYQFAWSSQYFSPGQEPWPVEPKGQSGPGGLSSTNWRRAGQLCNTRESRAARDCGSQQTEACLPSGLHPSEMQGGAVG